jgi:hypothetical protein
MYEKPNLNRVGDAQDVILGIVQLGTDLDTTWISGQDEYVLDDEGSERF